MSRRPGRLPRLAAAAACLGVLASGCGILPGADDRTEDPGPVLLSDDADPQDVADAWVSVVCEGDPTDVEAEYTDAEISLACTTRGGSDPEADADENDLAVFADPDDTTETDSDDCDVPYMVLGGPLWTARVYYSDGQQELLDLGVDVICEGN